MDLSASTRDTVIAILQPPVRLEVVGAGAAEGSKDLPSLLRRGVRQDYGFQDAFYPVARQVHSAGRLFGFQENLRVVAV
jgi:hypothetical protein